MAQQVRSTTASGVSGAGVYETQKAVDEYLQFHFDNTAMPYSFGPKEALEFPARLAMACEKHSLPDSRKTALDLGCAVGGATFELSKTFSHVLGIDFSAAFIAAAQEMKTKGEKSFGRLVEGEIYEQCVAKIGSGAHPDRAEFKVGDACNLGNIGPFDCILAANLLCRLPEPFKFLNNLPSLITTGGILVLVSPYSWLEEYTPKQHWVGGYNRDGTPIFSADVVGSTLGGLGFEQVDQCDIPFLIREHRRKFQWGCSHMTVWRKK